MAGKVTHIQLTAQDWAEIDANVAAARVRADQRRLQWQAYRRGELSAEEFGGSPVIDEDGVGLIGESDGRRFYLTDCCGASAKGVEHGVACRNCYQPIDPALGGIPADPAILARLAVPAPEWAQQRAGQVVSDWMAAGMNLGRLRDLIAEAIAAVEE